MCLSISQLIHKKSQQTFILFFSVLCTLYCTIQHCHCLSFLCLAYNTILYKLLFDHIEFYSQMANIEENSSENIETLPPSAPPLPPPAPLVVANGVEQGQTPSADVEQGQTPSVSVVKMTKITKSWRREDLYKNGSLALRAMGLLFSFLALIIMATNNHDGQIFNDYEEYRFVIVML